MCELLIRNSSIEALVTMVHAGESRVSMFRPQCDMFQWPNSYLTSFPGILSLALQKSGESLVHYFTHVMSGLKDGIERILTMHDHT